jgi:hypothetical protein
MLRQMGSVAACAWRPLPCILCPAAQGTPVGSPSGPTLPRRRAGNQHHLALSDALHMAFVEGCAVMLVRAGARPCPVP